MLRSGTADTLVLDETRPVGSEEDGDSDPAGLATVTANFADNFAAVTDFGSDGPGSVAYSLALSGANGIGFGIVCAGCDRRERRADGDGIGQGAEILLNQVGNGDHRLGGRHRLLHDQASPRRRVW